MGSKGTVVIHFGLCLISYQSPPPLSKFRIKHVKVKELIMRHSELLRSVLLDKNYDK